MAAAEAARILGKEIEPLPDGQGYRRKITINGVTEWHEKRMFGKPLQWKSHLKTGNLSTASNERSTTPPRANPSAPGSVRNSAESPTDSRISSASPTRNRSDTGKPGSSDALQAAEIADREIAEEADRIENPEEQRDERPQEFLKETLSRWTAGRLDHLEMVVPGTKNLLTDAHIKNARIGAALRAFRERIEENVRKSFGYPSWWREPQNRGRLKRFTAELLPTAARLNAVGRGRDGQFQFESFWMRAGELSGNQTKATGVNGGAVTLREGVFVQGRNGEKLKVLRKVSTFEGKRHAGHR